MSVLARDRVLEEIKKGNIKITDFNEKFLGPASYDLQLGNEFRTYLPRKEGEPIDIHEKINYKDFTKKMTVKDGDAFTIAPKATILAITKEKISLSDGFCGLLEGRSKFARMGLFIHITAGFMNPGINNQQVLEIFNANPSPVKLYPGTRLCQFVFLKLDGKAKYQGIFRDQAL